MSYPTQDGVSKRLHQEMFAALDKIQSKRIKEQARIWGATRRSLRVAVYEIYNRASPQGRWSLPVIKIGGLMDQLRAVTKSILMQYHAESTSALRKCFRQMRKHSILRHAWILDQITPRTTKIRVPAKVRMFEAVRRGNMTDWEERWSMWVDSYHTSLNQNILMGAMNESSARDAMDEVDATKAGTPAFSISDALTRIFNYEVVRQIAEGEDDVMLENEDAVDEEIWRTRGNASVCDECLDNEGETAQSALGYIPLHPNCNCYWELVPRSFANLLRDGGEAAMELARQMDVRGLVPRSMIIRDEDGNMTGKTIVDFNSWVDDQKAAIRGGM